MASTTAAGVTPRVNRGVAATVPGEVYTLEYVFQLDAFSVRTRLRALKMLTENIASGLRLDAAVDAAPLPPKRDNPDWAMTDDQIFECARTIEESIYAITVVQKTEYERKVLQVAWNLLQNGRLLLQKYPPAMLVSLDNSLLAEGTAVEWWWATHNKKLNLEKVLLNDEAAFDETEQLANSGLTCNRCHSRLIAIQQQQIRSADEGMTVFCTCKKCGMRWKM